ncbi:ferritin-like domain-containing protein [Nonomuraea rubra]|uniref:ferritin-like domain-containing protein n=1 Tax=Nonomuraea rubra TaxID=46180 RepID=UPI003CD0569E
MRAVLAGPGAQPRRRGGGGQRLRRGDAAPGPGRERCSTPWAGGHAWTCRRCCRPIPAAAAQPLELSLLPFGPEALEMFLRLEQPAPPGAPPQGDGYETIGQFYDAVEQGLRHLCEQLGERAVFSGDPARPGGRHPLPATPGARCSRWRTWSPRWERWRRSSSRARARPVGRGLGRRPGHLPPRTGRGRPLLPLMELKLGRRYQRGDTPKSGPTGERISVNLSAVRRCGPTRGCPTTPPQRRPHGAGEFNPHLLHPAEPAGAGLRRRPEAARRRRRHHVRAQGPGPPP